jgi:hypothetical protein
MDDLKINNIQKKFINTKEKFNYLFGLLIDNNLKKYTEEHEISNLFEIDSTLDMLNISLGSTITNIEMFDNMGLLSNNVIDYSIDNNIILDQEELDTINNCNDVDELERLVELHNLKESISKQNNNDDKSIDSNVDDNDNDNDNDNNNEQDNIINYMSNFVQSINKENKKCIPKVLLPMILYAHMKMDPGSILNKDIPKFDENMFQNGQYNFDILNNKNNDINEINEEQYYNTEKDEDYSTDNSVVGSGVEDLD